jgi:succinoglycan biosynthesis protein ExoO
MSTTPKVTVIIPTYNSASFVGRAIRSVLEQSMDDLELLVVDDGSTDGTVDALTGFRDSRLRLIRHSSNRGQCEARNTGLRAARGEWIAALDNDDAWPRERLAKLVDLTRDYPEAMIGSDALICFFKPDQGEIIPWKTVLEKAGLHPGRLYFPSLADFVKYGLDVKPIFRRSQQRDNAIFFNQQLRGHDWLYFLARLHAAGSYFVFLNEPLYYFSIRQESLSTRYGTIVAEAEGSRVLERFDWIDRATKREIARNRRHFRYRLIAAALRERLWAKALAHAVAAPWNLVFLIIEAPRHLSRQIQFRRNLKKANDRAVFH